MFSSVLVLVGESQWGLAGWGARLCSVVVATMATNVFFFLTKGDGMCAENGPQRQRQLTNTVCTSMALQTESRRCCEGRRGSWTIGSKGDS